MNKETIKYPKFSETDFIRLYCAINVLKGLSPIIKHHELETTLYKVYSLPDFKELFQDICPKKNYATPQRSYLDLETAINTAQTFGLLTQIKDMGETRSLVSCNEKTAQEIIANSNEEMVNKMTNLFTVIDETKHDTKTKQTLQGPVLIKKKTTNKITTTEQSI